MIFLVCVWMTDAGWSSCWGGPGLPTVLACGGYETAELAVEQAWHDCFNHWREHGAATAKPFSLSVMFPGTAPPLGSIQYATNLSR